MDPTSYFRRVYERRTGRVRVLSVVASFPALHTGCMTGNWSATPGAVERLGRVRAVTVMGRLLELDRQQAWK
jgi:hypothetical protein